MNTFLACAVIFALSFLAIWAFWFVEKLRGDSAPKVATLVEPVVHRQVGH